MKTRFRVYLIIVISIALFFVLWSWLIQYKTNLESKKHLAENTLPVLTQTSFKNSNQTAAVSSMQNTLRPTQNSNTQAYSEMLEQSLESKNRPIEFYGKVINQDSNSLSGVKIKLVVRHWGITASDLSTSIHLERATDSNGRFDIRDVTGDGFDIDSIGKDGYKLEPGQRSFGAVGGNAESPIIFKMWSTNIHEQLITGGKPFQIQSDGRPYFINFENDTINESGEGDLRVWIQYTNHVIRGQPYDWSCEIDAINGGLLEEPLGSAMYVAPTEGYVPTFQLQQQIKGGQYGSIGTRRFYIMLKSGKEYGQITIEMIAPYNDKIPSLIRLSYAINPSGSHILKP
jgi:hypothetical protein